MSHGEPYGPTGEDGIVCHDGACVPISWVESRFNNANAPKLIHKPKVLLFHCCRGESKLDTGVRMQHTLQRSQSRRNEDDGEGDHERDGVDQSYWKAGGDGDTLPTVTDMLVLYSTVPGESWAGGRNQRLQI
jgi:caspase-like apoptosis-related cysteine protease